ncbi:hypothetical protein [Landjia virus]|uniref:Uncharacterized protein n=1 Tax=Landjia virus TaxID=1272947 RepID=A0A0D3R1J1_9RHAB|nr:hypothetical protein [Landjia virus]AJR28486.1 hypothetical protein [Landjia virus]
MDYFLHGGISIHKVPGSVTKEDIHYIMMKVINDLIHDLSMPHDLAGAAIALILSNVGYRDMSDGSVEGEGYIQEGVSFTKPSQHPELCNRNWEHYGHHYINREDGSFFEYFIFMSRPLIFIGKPYIELWSCITFPHNYHKMTLSPDLLALEYDFAHMICHM